MRTPGAYALPPQGAEQQMKMELGKLSEALCIVLFIMTYMSSMKTIAETRNIYKICVGKIHVEETSETDTPRVQSLTLKSCMKWTDLLKERSNVGRLVVVCNEMNTA
jgi:hypothetical protein